MCAIRLKAFVLLLISLYPILLFGQDASLEKYWQYRKRFNDHFIVRGYEDGSLCDFSTGGYSVPFEALCTPSRPGIVATMDKSDNAEKLGWYIAVLATEYRLLKDAGESTDDILLETWQALKAYERLDWKAEGNIPIVPSSTCNLNGILMRDDANHRFFKIAFKKIFKNNPNYATRSNAVIFNQLALDVADVQTIDEPSNNIMNDSQRSDLGRSGGFNFKAYYDSEYWARDDPNPKEFNLFSKDHMIWLMMGFALVRNYMYDAVYIDPVTGANFNFTNSVQTYTNNFMNEITKNPITSTAPPGPPISNGWYIGNPKDGGNQLCDKISSSSYNCFEVSSGLQSFGIGFDKAAQYITGNRKCQDFACAPYDAIGWSAISPTYIPSSSGEFDFVRNFYHTPAINLVKTTIGLAVGIVGGPVLGPIAGPISVIVADPVLKNLINRNSDRFIHQENHSIIYALAAIGDSWVGPSITKDIFSGEVGFNFLPGQTPPLSNNNTAQLLSYVTQKSNTYIFALLHKALHNSNLNLPGNAGNFDANRVRLDIEAAPPCGTQYLVGSSDPVLSNYNPDYGGFSGWYGQNKWIRSRDANCQTASSDQGLFNGLDFMLLYNLYRLTYGGGSTNYKNLMNTTSRSNYPYLVSGNGGGGSGISNLVKASLQQPENLTALNNIESSATVSYLDLLDCGLRPRDGSTAPPCTTIVRYWADETFSATENVKLTSGFKVKVGAKFHAKIDGSLGCNSYIGGGGNTCPKNIRIASPEPEFANPESISLTNENHMDKEVSIFPNPVDKILSINYNLSNEGTIIWALTRLDGVEINNGNIKAISKGKFQSNIDVSYLSTGLYVFKATVSGKSFIQKIVKE